MSSTTRFPIYTGDIIDGGRLQLLSILGQGGFGVVYKAVDVLDPEHTVYAVKWLGLPTLSSRQQVSPGEHAQRLAKLEHEADMHARVSDHPNILTLHRTVMDDERKCRWMVSDYISGGDVFDAQTQRNPFWRNDERTRSICLQLIDAIAHCHRQGVYHRDIKPENLLLSADGNTIYLSDFGCSTTKRYCTDVAGTTEYMAPEQVDPHFRARIVYRDFYSSAKADIWATAMTILGMLLGDVAWEQASTNCERYTNITNYLRYGHLDDVLPLSTGFVDLFKRTFERDPMRRLDLKGMRHRIEGMSSLFPSPLETRIGARRHAAYLEELANNWVDSLPIAPAATTTLVASPPSGFTFELASTDGDFGTCIDLSALATACSAFDQPATTASSSLGATSGASTSSCSCPSLASSGSSSSSSSSSEPATPIEEEDIGCPSFDSVADKAADLLRTPRVNDLESAFSAISAIGTSSPSLLYARFSSLYHS